MLRVYIESSNDRDDTDMIMMTLVFEDILANVQMSIWSSASNINELSISNICKLRNIQNISETS